jgi:hypothetical protein
VIQFPPLLEDHRIPHLVYLTSEGSVKGGERLVTRLPVGATSKQMHLMCEHHDEIHKIDNQLGSIMRFDDKTLKSV